VFATDVLTGGPNYLLSYLDIPQQNGQPIYDGPYKGDHQADFDKAVTCDGNTITYHFNKAWPDFPLSVAMLFTTDPYKQSFDQGPKSQWLVMSNGPYEIDGSYNWDKNNGAMLVRNPNYDPATDDPSIRMALPDKIDYNINGSPDSGNQITERLIADAGKDSCAITSARIGPTYYTRVANPPVSDRTMNVVSPYTFYLVPNFDRLTNPLVRQALAEATNKTAYITAIGGTKAASPADSIVNPGVGGYLPNPAFADIPPAGDVQKAKDLLAQAGVQTPYPINFTYSSSPTADKAAAALKETWDAAGFDVTLDGLTDTYYDVIQKPDKTSDIMLAGWGADWPSAMTVLPPLFDDRPNFSKNSYGQDYGGYKSADFDALVDQASSAASVDEQNKILQQADALLGKDVAYIPLYNLNFYWIWGSHIVNFVPTASSSMNPDLGVIGVDPTACS
jgi:peptide/nickel transport system substrate-binding protein